MSLLVAIAAASLHLVPLPDRIQRLNCVSSVPHTVAANFDPAAREEVGDRWRALGIGELQTVAARQAAVTVTRDPSLPPQAYRLTVASGRASIASADGSGAFYAAMTLAQLPGRSPGGWSIPCVRIEDRPALSWRILSDDVSRGPLPTTRYFEERIRTIAAFKMNGYSPYMEHVFLSPTDPLPAPLDGITPSQLRALAAYAARFHVTLIPEQQTFAHMHNTLKVERYSGAAELPHAFLLAPNVPLSNEYLTRVITQELNAVGRTPFFHIGSDETATLGLGRTAAYVAQRGRSRAYADHIIAMNQVIAPSGARIMLWDDGIENDPSIMGFIPKNAIIVNWHYGDEPTFEPYIRTIARGGFEQMVAPGANNWNEIFPRLALAQNNERRFINEGKSSHVLGLFQTVWHDDGETLYEATWYPVIYAAAAAWQHGDVSPTQFDRDFAAAFFGVEDAHYIWDSAQLDLARADFEPPQGLYEQTDALFWADPFDAAAGKQVSADNLRAARISAELVEEDLYSKRPPLHANVALVMFLAARRFDVLARKFQIAAEVRAMYDDARAHLSDNATAERDLRWCMYWMWELRDAYEELAPLYARAWTYESRDGHLASNLERYHLAAQKAIERADAFYRVIQEYDRTKTLPPFDTVVSL